MLWRSLKPLKKEAYKNYFRTKNLKMMPASKKKRIRKVDDDSKDESSEEEPAPKKVEN